MIRRPVRPSLKPLVRRTPLRSIGPRGMKRRAEYAKYLKSSTWRKIRRRFIEASADVLDVTSDGYRYVVCEKCGTMLAVGRSVIHVHHKRYLKTLGQESLTDLAIRCERCHLGGDHWYKRP